MAENRPVFWISGNQYDSRKMFNKIVQMLDNPNIESLDCGFNSDDTPPALRSLQAGDVIRRLKSQDLFDSRPRILKLNGLPPDYLIFNDYLNYVNDNNILVFYGPVGYSSGKRFVSAKTSGLYKTIQNMGNAHEFTENARTSEEAVNWLNIVCKENKIKVENDALVLLVESKGRYLDVLYSEILKAHDYVEGEIKVPHIQECCSLTLSQTVWNLIEELDSQQLEASLIYLERVYAEADQESASAVRSDIEMLLGALYYHYLLLLLIKDGCGIALSSAQAQKVIKGYKKKVETEQGIEWKDVYDARSIGASLSNSSFQSAFQWAKSKIYMLLSGIVQIKNMMRQTIPMARIKYAMDGFCLFACNNISHKQFQEIITI